MTDLAKLESQILSQIGAASDETALEAVRVAALGKKGSISALLSTLGKMSPDERKTQGAAINLAKDLGFELSKVGHGDGHLWGARSQSGTQGCHHPRKRMIQ